MTLPKRSLTYVGAALLALALSTPAGAEPPTRGGKAGRSGPPHPEHTVDWTKTKGRIAWYGTLAPARKAAKKTGRPILIISGAPHCRAVPGVW